jgi:hypothetical protein
MTNSITYTVPIVLGTIVIVGLRTMQSVAKDIKYETHYSSRVKQPLYNDYVKTTSISETIKKIL